MKVYGGSESCAPKFVIVSSNETFHTHQLGNEKCYATHVFRRGVKENSTAARDFAEHSKAIRMRVLEVRIFHRPKLDQFAIHCAQDPANCRLGLFAALLKELSRHRTRINCTSHYFLPQIFEALRRNAREYAMFAQNHAHPDEFEELLLDRIAMLQEKLSPALPLLLGAENNDEDNVTAAAEKAVGLSILEDGPEEHEETQRHRASTDIWPLFRKRHNTRDVEAVSQTSTPAKKEPALFNADLSIIGAAPEFIDLSILEAAPEFADMAFVADANDQQM